MEKGIALAVLVMIIGVGYLYYDNKNLGGVEETREVSFGFGIIFLSVIMGGFLGFLIFEVMQSTFGSNDVRAYIGASVITLSAIICGCTGWIVKALKDLHRGKWQNEIK